MSTRRPTAPPVRPAPDWHFPTPTRHTLSNGLTVLGYHLPGQHIVSATLACRVPLSAEPVAGEGVAMLTARNLDEGSRAHPGDTFADLLEAEGAAIAASVAQAGTQVLLDVPASHLPVALPLLAEAVTQPEFAADNVDRHVALRLAEIEQARANSSRTATRVFAQTLFDSSTRVSRPTGGLSDTVSTLDADAVAAFHAQHYRVEDSVLILGGEIGEHELALAEAAFGSWASNGATPNPGPQATRCRPPSAVLVHRPGAVQADLRLGGPGIDRRDPRWAAAVIGGYAVGGAFLSRLNKVLREERGYTYGVGMSFSPHVHGGSFTVSGSFRTDVLTAAVVEARDLLDATRAPFTAAEVAQGVDFYTGVAPLRYATADAVVDQAATEFLAGLDQGYLDGHLARVRQVTAESATAAYTDLVDPDALTLVVVGDADVLAPQLTQAGFAIEVTNPAD